MNSYQIREKFLTFFKKRGHKIIPSSSLIPKDPTSLFTSAGMQQLVLYLAGEKDPLKDFGKRELASIQKCFRSDDIEEVGDDTHHTFFEMLGNWSIGKDLQGGYFKEGAIKLAIDFFVKELGLEKEKLWITIFKGEKNIPKDRESFEIWQKVGIPRERIREFGMEDNFWGPVGETGPCGPCTEIHYDRGSEFGCKSTDCGPNCKKCQRFVELWNLVFMEYNKVKRGDNFSFEKLSQTNVDTGIGLERLIAILNKKESAYETDLFLPLINILEKYSKNDYSLFKKEFRIIADHLRAICFLIAEGISPSNLARGYILRRLLRRIIRFSRKIELANSWYQKAIKETIMIYQKQYPFLSANKEKIITIFLKEKERFEETLEIGLKEFQKIIQKKNFISGKDAFYLYQSFGFPLELTVELAEENNLRVDIEGFEREKKAHQDISRKGAQKKFGGVGIERIFSEKEKERVTKLHTATHLLQAALREVLGERVAQVGSDISPERLRFDFTFERKLTEEEICKVEELVNKKIKENLKVKVKEMPLKQALNSGALSFFKEKYPEIVKVYSIFNPKTGEVFSKEICAGPHVKETKVLGFFKILKQENLGKGKRRIRATIE